MKNKMVRIVDIGPKDARYHLREEMIGMIVKVLEIVELEAGWYFAITTCYSSQMVKIYKDTDYYSWKLEDFMTHAWAKLEEIHND